MVQYCCVKGCSNNSGNRKKNPNDITSFHAFPSISEIKAKWLRAIGRPDWDPPSHAFICSTHFMEDQINRIGRRTRIKDDACPTIGLPPNSNFEASFVEVCRICLATDLMMYTLQEGMLKICMESIIGLNKKYVLEGMPQYVCYECAAHLIKCYTLIEKSKVAQTILLDIFVQHNEINKTLIKARNRDTLKLKSSLTCQKVLPLNIFEYRYDDEQNCSYLITKFDNMDCKENEENGKLKETVNDSQMKAELINNIDLFTTSLKIEADMNYFKTNEIRKNDEHHFSDEIEDNEGHYDSDSDQLKINRLDELSLNEDSNDEENCINDNILTLEHTDENIENNKQHNMISLDGLTPDEVSMQNYFNIVKLTLKEQIEEWSKARNRQNLKSKMVYECEKCSKKFAYLKSYKSHIGSHNLRRGKAECPVCKARFKNDTLVNLHAKRMHSKKFHCKLCPRVLSNVGVAKKHHLWHAGHVYECGACPYRTAHQSALGAHARRHGAVACASCGRSCVSERGLRLHMAAMHRDQPVEEGNEMYRCDQCNINFVSEGAKRMHIITSSQHKKKSNLCDPTPRDPDLATTCSKCGATFATPRDLTAHVRAQHPRAPRRGASWRLPDDRYPTQCEHCGESIINRHEHYWHTRRKHPTEIDSYRPVITAVCDICGKGFQNSTKLHLHELRHGSPSVRCSQCPRVFYDKYSAARHAAVHSVARPYVCHCGQAFKQRNNLDRHNRIHTGITPYQCSLCGKKFKYSTSMNLHIRTVHYKLPHPPRKKRTRKAANTTSLADINNEHFKKNSTY